MDLRRAHWTGRPWSPQTRTAPTVALSLCGDLVLYSTSPEVQREGLVQTCVK
jgi:hypothetical protein